MTEMVVIQILVSLESFRTANFPSMQWQPGSSLGGETRPDALEGSLKFYKERSTPSLLLELHIPVVTIWMEASLRLMSVIYPESLGSLDGSLTLSLIQI